MNNMKNIVYILLGYIVFATLGLLTSCSKDDAAEKMPVITGVRVIDPTLRQYIYRMHCRYEHCPDGTQLGFYV